MALQIARAFLMRLIKLPRLPPRDSVTTWSFIDDEGPRKRAITRGTSKVERVARLA